MQKPALSLEEKERLAFRTEMLTLLSSAGDLLDDIHEMMHETPKERETRAEKEREHNLGDRINTNSKTFARYLREARNLPDDEDLFFKGLETLRKKL